MSHRNHNGWVKYVEPIENILNFTRNGTTGFTPAELMLEIPPQPIFKILPPTIVKGKELTLEEKCDLAFHRIFIKSEIRKHKVKRSKRIWNPNVGEKVLVKKKCLSNASKKKTSKMNLIYSGPYIVNQIFGNHTYELTDEKGKVIGRYHKIHLKKYIELNENNVINENEGENNTE